MDEVVALLLQTTDEALACRVTVPLGHKPVWPEIVGVARFVRLIVAVV